MRIPHLAILAATSALAWACAPIEPEAPPVATGSLQMPLEMEAEGVAYRLADAVFVVAGPDGASEHRTDPRDGFLQIDLTPAEYTITLQDGWQMLAARDGGEFEPVPAALHDDPSQIVAIEPGAVARLTYRFLVDDLVVVGGAGRVTIDVDALKPPLGATALCTEDAQCGAGRVCADHWCRMRCSNNECPQGYLCEAGDDGVDACYPKPPYGTRGPCPDCPAGSQCAPDGWCRATCRNNECPGSYLCEFETQICYPRCYGEDNSCPTFYSCEAETLLCRLP